MPPGAHPCAVPGLKLVAEADNLPWHVRLHDRSTMQYSVHMVVAKAEAAASEPSPEQAQAQ
jgi:hypothetical protein